MNNNLQKFIEAITEPSDALIKKIQSDTSDSEVKANKYVESVINEKINTLWKSAGNFDDLLKAIVDLVAVLAAAYYIVDVEYGKEKFENIK